MIGDYASSLQTLFSHWANGAIAFGLWVGALFFFNGYRRTRDRFFVFLAASFVVMLIDRLIWGLFGKSWDQDEQVSLRILVYAIRLVGFLIIAFGVVDKNRRAEKAKSSDNYLKLVPPGGRKSA
ncbi:MAG TPA: DUF5985 family protein [Candidatus Obscuribacterales bacterium]